ncbi:MAG: signal peptidase II [Candidatus Nanoarchaeia archaeon]|nr:signal peptidase II [Candidatus Nanoarchaeia archaeon]
MKINKVFSNPIFYLIIFIVLFFDQLTKVLFQFKNITLIPNLLSITYSENAGIVFGFFERNVLFLYIIPLLVIIFILYYLNKKELNYIGSALVIAGLLGNIIDRARLGYVIDWFFIHIIPKYNVSLFNIADASLISGVIILIYFLYKK